MRLERRTTLRWKAYGALIRGLSALHYVALAPLSRSDEGGGAWFRRRLEPELPVAAADGRRIWIHAVSAGEAKVAELLRHELMAIDRGLSVVLSSTTYSGFARVLRVAGEAASFVMPLDTIAAQRRVFETVRPDLLVLVESEFWPAQFAAAAETGVPVVVVNATMSERSFARHRRFSWVAAATLRKAARIYPQDEVTLRRYAELGVPPERLEISGNLKLVSQSAVARKPVEEPLTVTFGNVHEAEVPQIAGAVARLRSERPDIRIILVPRYPGKLSAEALRRAFGGELQVVGSAGMLDSAGRLVWVDEMGVLAELYGRSAIGVVCGTFAPIGGHDLSEPLHLGAASLYGPHVERQRALDQALKQMRGAVQVADAGQLPEAIAGLLDRPAEREAMIERFRELSQQAAQRVSVIAATLIGMARPQ